ncbi:bacteriocin-like protein [Mucilaginibacter xinganensis]|uniref:Bacteriocin-type signal sequence-containing protein n=1 Tax=Mucilaginibacter xinganensis TaxID=1234841 RepID=A0A223NRK1_9SPHI|nr:bacteriocin [Mucilaginibacter xinganensis]ASU32535.1 hypothetical protein MuYL_0632 [Mucilaginibacter xinganensis]
MENLKKLTKDEMKQVKGGLNHASVVYCNDGMQFGETGLCGDYSVDHICDFDQGFNRCINVTN